MFSRIRTNGESPNRAGQPARLEGPKNMAFSLAPLLIHSEAVPMKAREALRAVSSAPSEQRGTALRSAAKLLYAETSLDCGDAMELVGLQNCGCE